MKSGLTGIRAERAGGASRSRWGGGGEGCRVGVRRRPGGGEEELHAAVLEDMSRQGRETPEAAEGQNQGRAERGPEQDPGSSKHVDIPTRDKPKTHT